jgi:TatD DNase family protein
LIDSHCHLADPAFSGDLEEVVRRARAAGVDGGLCVLALGDAAEERQATRVRVAWPELRYAVGAHPHQAHQFASRTAEVSAAVEAACARVPGVCAVGEIGLDYHYDLSPRDVQREVFRQQVAFAREAAWPIVIHTREADEDTVRLLGEEGRGEVQGVFHCFSGTAELARAALDLGFVISFSGIVTFPKAEALRAIAAAVPADRLLVETDCPYLAPVPRRGRRNEPAWLVHTAEAVAELRGMTRAELEARVAGNFARLFPPLALPRNGSRL